MLRKASVFTLPAFYRRGHGHADPVNDGPIARPAPVATIINKLALCVAESIIIGLLASLAFALLVVILAEGATASPPVAARITDAAAGARAGACLPVSQPEQLLRADRIIF